MTAQNSSLLALTSEGAATALETGRIDAAFFIMSPTVPLVRRLLLSPTVSLWSVRRTTAYTTRYRFLSTVTLGEGAVDLAANIPDRDIVLLAATATLVVREDVHPVIVRLLLKTAEIVHSRPGLFEAPHAFPSDTLVELPLHEVARRYLRKGPPLLERYLPFWIAVTAERWALLLLPVVGIMLPLIGILPSLYNSQMRKQVTRWYREVHDIDHALAHATPEEAQAAAQQLRDVQARLAEIPPPPSGLMGEYYALKQHVEWLIERADARRGLASLAEIDLPRARVRDHFAPRALDDHLAEVQHRDPLGEVEGHVHVVLDHDDRHVARNARDQPQHVAPLVDRQPGEGLVEEQYSWILGQRHGHLDAAALAVRGLGERPVGEVIEADPRQGLARLDRQRLLPAEPHERVPAPA